MTESFASRRSPSTLRFRRSSRAFKRINAQSASGHPALAIFSAGESLAAQLVEIVLPIGVPIAAELDEIVPAVDAGRVHVVEHETHRIVANGLHFEDRHVLLAGDGLALVRRMALHLGARAAYAQILGGELIALAAIEGDRQGLAVLV